MKFIIFILVCVLWLLHFSHYTDLEFDDYGPYASYYYGSDHTAASTATPAVVNEGLLIYITLLFFVSVVLEYLYKREFDKLVCGQAKRDAKARLSQENEHNDEHGHDEH